ncbi:MAG: PaaI family thioesterase [Sphingomonas sp.]
MSDPDGEAVASQRLGFAPDPENPGWLVRPVVETGAFVDIFGEMRVLVEAPDKVRLRVYPGPQQRNLVGSIHGGFLLALVDQALFAAPTRLKIAGARDGVTIDCSTQFLSAGRIGEPLDAVVEILRETGRMVFMRGLLEQGGTRVLAFSGTIRKATVRT